MINVTLRQRSVNEVLRAIFQESNPNCFLWVAQVQLGLYLNNVQPPRIPGVNLFSQMHILSWVCTCIYSCVCMNKREMFARVLFICGNSGHQKSRHMFAVACFVWDAFCKSVSQQTGASTHEVSVNVGGPTITKPGLGGDLGRRAWVPWLGYPGWCGDGLTTSNPALEFDLGSWAWVPWLGYPGWCLHTARLCGPGMLFGRASAGLARW